MDRDALLKTLRGVEYDGLDRSVDVAISRLRKKLLDSAAEPYRIKTIRNKGYLLPLMHRTKRRDKLADRFYLPLSSHSGDAHHRHCSKQTLYTWMLFLLVGTAPLLPFSLRCGSSLRLFRSRKLN